MQTDDSEDDRSQGKIPSNGSSERNETLVSPIRRPEAEEPEYEAPEPEEPEYEVPEPEYEAPEAEDDEEEEDD